MSQAEIEEKKFFEWLENRKPSEKSEDEYTQRDDEAWKQCSKKYLKTLEEIGKLKVEQENIKKQLIFLSGHVNSRGAGLSLSQVRRKGNVDYSKIEALKDVDLEQYRKPEIVSWRITI